MIATARFVQSSLFLAFFSFMLLSCVQTTEQYSVVNGRVDPVEAALIQVAVGLSMQSQPQTVVPAYGVTSALLAARDNDLSGTIRLGNLDSLVAIEVNKLNLDPMTLQSCNDLIALVRAKINQKLSLAGVPENDRLVVVWQVIEIINKTAEARMDAVMTTKVNS